MALACSSNNYPRTGIGFIRKITQSRQAKVYTLTSHFFRPGNLVQFNIPRGNAYDWLDSKIFTVVGVGDSCVKLDLNSRSFPDIGTGHGSKSHTYSYIALWR